MSSGADLTRQEQAVINAFQGGFPVTARPYEPAAAALQDAGVAVTADELLDIVRDLDERNVLSRFGALINADAIGGQATLVAMHAPATEFDAIVSYLNGLDAVAHNYERDHPQLNIWFVLSVADPDRIPELLAEIETETGQQVYNLPKRREFHLRATFPVDGPLADGGIDLTDHGPTGQQTSRSGITTAERDLLLAIQDGFPLTPTPYADIATEIGQSTAWVLETITRFREADKFRRIGVIPRHYALGYTENAMTVWDIPNAQIEPVGEAVAAMPFVTHCYQRPRHPGVWPYSLFAMAHGRTQAEVSDRIDQMHDRIRTHVDVTADDWTTLYSEQILKKTGLRLADRTAARVQDGDE